jgi:signal transduction histidine kinase
MTQSGYALVGMTAIVAALVTVLLFAVLRFTAAARDARGRPRESGGETAFMAAALQETMAKLKAQERAMAVRAEASERLSSEIVVSLTAGLLVVDLDKQVRILNPAGWRLLNLPPGQVLGSYRDVLADASPLADVMEECLRTGQAIVRRALEMPGERQVASHLGVTVSPLSGPNGQLHGVICLFTDLTSVIDMEEQLRLKDSLARVGELTAGIAHEFRNGLATIHGYARLLDLETLPPAYRPYIEGIRQETASLGQVVTNFLTFARPAQLALAPVDLQAIVERAAEEIRADARARGGDVVVQGTFPTIEGDDVLLRQAFSNLMRNALEACIAAGTPPSVVIDGVVDAEQGTARVSVFDNGPGVDPASRERVFRPFFTTKKQGTGLGLALVQKIVVTHNGRIGVGSSPAGGASFQISLPVRPPSEALPEALPNVTK